MIYLYTGEMEIVTQDNVHSLLLASSTLMLDEILTACHSLVEDVITTENITEFLHLVEITNDKKLLAICKSFVLNHYDECVKQDVLQHLTEFKDFTAELMKELLPKRK